MKIKKRKKSTRMHGRNMGTHGRGARKKAKGKGHRGGKGLSGTGKRGDHKKTLITKKHGHDYFGKKGLTSRKTERDKRQRINVGQVQNNLEKYGKKKGDVWEINLENYKLLGSGEVREKINIKVLESSKSARDKIEKAGGKIVFLKEAKKSE